MAVLIDFSRAYGRGLLRGVAQYVRQHHTWSVQSEEWRWADPVPPWLRKWKGDGVVAWVEAPAMTAALQKLGVPVVDVRGVTASGLPVVDTENAGVAQLAAGHLLQRGFRHFAYCGFTGANYSETRGHWFREHLARAGYSCTTYQPPPPPPTGRHLEHEKRGLLFQDHLVRWLAALPKPVGLMACNDIRGQQVLNACRRAGLLVPEQVAVVGVDNDDVFCELSDPPLTSVALDTLRIGYEAAAQLERLMAGGRAPAAPLLIPPLGLVTRRSSDVLALHDQKLAAGARHLREHLFEPLTTDDLARAAGLSRRAFERRFGAVMGRAPRAEIQRLRLERVKALLAETEWTLEEIAGRTGYKYAEYLHAVFSRKIGVTPGQYRRQARRMSAAPPPLSLPG